MGFHDGVDAFYRVAPALETPFYILIVPSMTVTECPPIHGAPSR